MRQLFQQNVLIVGFIVLVGCHNRTRDEVRTIHEGSFTVKARFVDGKRTGKSDVYDSSGNLNGTLTYLNDTLSGICTHYFPNKVVSDSVMYLCDKPNGYWRFYNDGGELQHITYFYYGLQFGPDLWYRKDKILKAFRFLDFEREPIVECTYNSYGNLDSIEKIDLKVMLTEKIKGDRQVVEFFAYLPTIPLTVESYSVGIADKNHLKQKLADLKGENFMIDTVLATPATGYHFYLQCNVQDHTGKIIGVHIVEMIKKDEKDH